MNILVSFYQIVTGIGFGILFGLLGLVINCIDCCTSRLAIIKDIWIFSVALIILFATYFSGFNLATYLCSFVFGYVSHVVWRKRKPTPFLKWAWEFFLLPYLFGCVGASIQVRSITGNILG